MNLLFPRPLTSVIPFVSMVPLFYKKARRTLLVLKPLKDVIAQLSINPNDSLVVTQRT